MSRALPALASASTRGAAWAMLAFASFTGMDCTVKAIGAGLHVFQTVWMQTVVMLAAMLLASAIGGGWRRLRTQRPLVHLLRGLLSVASICLVFASYTRLPLTDVYGVLFTVPLMVTALGVPLLGERVTSRHWTAMLGGFAGVLVMSAPTGAGLSGAAMLLPLAGALCNALGFLLVRRMQTTETTESMGVYGNLIVLVVLAPWVPAVYEAPAPAELVLCAAGGVLGAAGFAALVLAYRSATAATVAPFQYTQMPWAVLAGLLLFHEQPGLHVLVGASMVVASGLFLMRTGPVWPFQERAHASQYGSGANRAAKKSTKVRTLAERWRPWGQTA